MAEIKWRTGEPPRNGNYLVDTGDEYCMDYWFIYTWDDYGDKVKGWMPIEGDIEEVVRCKDCAEWSDWGEANINYCPMLDLKTEGEFFCALGERKKDADESRRQTERLSDRLQGACSLDQ